MSPSRPLLLAILSATTTLGLLALGAPSVASAAVAPAAVASRPATGTSSSPYGPAPDGGASPAAVSPSGCIQRADYPHKSTHVPGTMNGQVRTLCRVYVPQISVTAQMWESRWWGWDRIGTRGSVNVIESKGITVNASDKCRNNTVRVTGSGTVVDVDGRSYYATTESIHVKNPCHL